MTKIFTFLFFAASLSGQNKTDSVILLKVDSMFSEYADFMRKRNFEKAKEILTEAGKISVEKLGPESESYAKHCFHFGRFYYIKQEFSESEKWYLNALSIQEKVMGRNNPNYALYNSNLAILYEDQGKFEMAESLYLESLSIFEKTIGKNHPNYAFGLSNLGHLYSKYGNFEKAESYHLSAKEVNEKFFGKEHPRYALNLDNLAIVYQNIGAYEKAELFILEALEIRKKTLGKDDVQYGSSLGNLASLYLNLGNYDKVEPLLIEAGSIFERKLDKTDPHHFSILVFSYIYNKNIGRYEKAETILLTAISLYESALNKNHPDYGGLLLNLGSLYLTLDKYDKAEPLLLQAKNIFESSMGKDNLNYALISFSLGILYFKTGDFNKGDSLILEAKSIRNKLVGRENNLYTEILSRQAILYWSSGYYEKVLLLFEELLTLEQILQKNAVHYLSEKELSKYIFKFSEDQAQMFSFAQNVISTYPEVSRVCYDNTLFYKGFLLQSSQQLKHIALIDSNSAKKINKLKTYKQRLAFEYAKPIQSRNNLQEIEANSNTLEKELAREVAAYRQALLQVNWKEVQMKLHEDEAAVEFVHYNYFSPHKTDSIIYAALIITSKRQSPLFIPMFEEKQLNKLLQAHSGFKIKDVLNALYMRSPYRNTVNENTALQDLYQLIWQPLLFELQNIKTIYYSPSGLLHRINLGAIPINEKEVMADKYNLIEMGSTRNLVINNYISDSSGYEKNLSGNKDALVYGGIEYDLDTTATYVEKVNTSTETPESQLATRGITDELKFSYTDSATRGGNWYYLKWTEKEIKAIESVLKSNKIKTQIQKSYSATEESFKQIGANNTSPQILHIATHGYFFPDRTSSAISRMTYDPDSIGTASDPDKRSGAKAASSNLKILQSESEPVFKISDHPMIRSGLILAGGNHAWKTGQPYKEGMEDGILTAYEISQMNLSNTELVVLSACETGLGDIQGNEGVYGLQRAFKIAGAKYLIMSLWQVPDKQTSMLMINFYKKWLEDKMPIPKAFHAAQKELRDNGLDPYHWAGFVLVE